MGAAPAAAAQPASAWQTTATGLDELPAALLTAAALPEVAIIDTGADLTAAPLVSRRITTYDVRTRSTTVADTLGHGTFVASLAGMTNAPLLIVKAAAPDGSITAAAEATAIRYAVDHGARVINLSFAGTGTSSLERSAVRYAVAHGVLLVAAAGNEFTQGNPVEYPAALLQPVGSKGRAGMGLVVGASTKDGARAAFSNSGSWISLAAPGESVLVSLTGTAPTLGSGTSYAAPQVAAAAALVWGLDPALSARQVAKLLEQTASGHGTWTPDLGYGVIDLPAAAAAAEALRPGAPAA
jgi:subtilisin family serine protease